MNHRQLKTNSTKMSIDNRSTLKNDLNELDGDDLFSLDTSLTEDDKKYEQIEEKIVNKEQYNHHDDKLKKADPKIIQNQNQNDNSIRLSKNKDDDLKSKIGLKDYNNDKIITSSRNKQKITRHNSSKNIPNYNKPN